METRQLMLVIAFLMALRIPLFAAPAFGTLQTEPEHLKEEYAGGVRVAMVEVFWDRFERAENSFDEAYIADVKSRIRDFKTAGFVVTLAPGTHFAPNWLKQLPDSKFIDQEGKQSPEVNYVFNQKMRGYLDRYLKHLDEQLDFDNFWAIRLTSGGNAELLYPDGGTYWAFDPNAQGGDGRPGTIAACPYPGWKPGTPGLDRQQVREWADWYVRCLADTVDWQMGVLDRLGFKGWYQILTPGTGVQPDAYRKAIAANLPNGLLGVGCVWQKVYEFIGHKDRAVVYISSVADASGNDDVTRREDSQVPLDDPKANSWSATRWQVRIAREFKMQVAGENPGFNMPAKLNGRYVDRTPDGMMARAFAQAVAGDFQVFYWAHSARLWDGTQHFADFAAGIAAATHGKVEVPSMP